MKTVRQTGDYDCGVAALAMLRGIEIGKAKEFCKSLYRDDYGIDADDLVICLGIDDGIESGRVVKLKAVSGFDGTMPYYDALLYGWLIPPQLEVNGPPTKGLLNTYDHWAVWDSVEQVVRDPYGYATPYWITHYYEVDEYK